jgi:ribose transport system substrate-binding protein
MKRSGHAALLGLLALVVAVSFTSGCGKKTEQKAKGKIKYVLGIDALPEEGALWVLKGELTATFIYEPPGAEGLRQALKILETGKPDAKRITLPTGIVNKENAEQFIAEMGSGQGTEAAGGEETETSGETTGEKYVIGFSQVTVSEPWRVWFNDLLRKEAAKHPEVELIVQDADDRTDKQNAQMDAFIAQKVDAILISPKEAPGLTDAVKRATEAGIPVVVLDRDVNWDGYACFVGGDNMEIGRAAGREAVRLLGGEGKAKGVIYEICGGLASTPAQERRDGFHEIVEKEPGITILGGLDGDWKLEKGKQIMQDALQAYDNIDLVYAHNDPTAYGAYQAAKAAGRVGDGPGQIKYFLGIDAIPEEGALWVLKGELTATFIYEPPGAEGLRQALKILETGKPDAKRITLPTGTVNKENAKEFIEKMGGGN